MKTGNKSKARKIGATIGILVLLLLLAVDIWGGNYLVSFAIGRSTSGGASVAPAPSTTSESREIVNQSFKRIAEETAQWKESIEPVRVEITSEDGLKLAGEMVMREDGTHKWAALIHGYTASRAMMWDYGCMFYSEGYNLLLPDMRGHGESEGNYIGMGVLDRKDVVQWINRILQEDAEAEIVLLGVSMGGATVMMTSGENLPANVKAIVEDCGYISVWDIFSDELKVLFHLPEFPILYTADMISRIRAGYSFHDGAARDQLKKAQVPVMFIHGSKDNFVHTEMVYELYDICPTKKDIFVVEEAGHGVSYYYAPEEYHQRVFAFLKEAW